MRGFVAALVTALALPATAEDVLYLYHWHNYTSEATIAPFEAHCRCRLRQDYYSDNEEMLAKLEALRKAESGREGKKIPDRLGGCVEARSPAGQVVAIDAGHGGADTGIVAAEGLTEKDLALSLAVRLEQLLRAEGCQVVLTRAGDQDVPLYERTETVMAAEAGFMLSLHANGNESPAAHGAACYFFQRSHYFSERGRRLAAHVGARLGETGRPRHVGTAVGRHDLAISPSGLGHLVDLDDVGASRRLGRRGRPESGLVRRGHYLRLEGRLQAERQGDLLGLHGHQAIELRELPLLGGVDVGQRISLGLL